MNIQQYIHSLTDEEFEQLCTEYLTLHYKNKMVDYLKKALIYGHTSRISS